MEFEIGDHIRYSSWPKDELVLVGFDGICPVVRRADSEELPTGHRYDFIAGLGYCKPWKPNIDELAAEIIETVRYGDDGVHAAVKQALTDGGF